MTCVWKGEWIWSKYVICMYEHRIIKPIKIILKEGGVIRKSIRGRIWSMYGNITVHLLYIAKCDTELQFLKKKQVHFPRTMLYCFSIILCLSSLSHIECQHLKKEIFTQREVKFLLSRSDFSRHWEQLQCMQPSTINHEVSCPQKRPDKCHVKLWYGFLSWNIPGEEKPDSNPDKASQSLASLDQSDGQEQGNRGDKHWLLWA
jgi:hypothetical protein